MRAPILSTLCLLVLIQSISTGAVSAALTTKPAAPVIPVFALRGPLGETPQDQTMAIFSGAQQQSLREMIERMDKARNDASIKAVVFLCDGGSAGAGQIEELRQAIGRLKDAGKAVYAHSDSADFRDYVLLSSATRLSVVPTADIWATGLHGESLYLRGLLDKIGVKPDFLTCGEYKSAVELFMRDGPSEAADKMHNWLFDGIYDSLTSAIATSRNMTADKVKSWIDEGPYTAEKAKDAGFIDAVESREEFNKFLRDKYGKDLTFDRKYGEKQQPQLDFNNPFALFQVLGEMFGGGAAQHRESPKPTIGIVYVDGAISLGGAEQSIFGSEGAHSSEIRRALDQAARDNSVKAVVLRVDSPGGSAVASEIILEATQRVKDKKPLVVSMGNVAGSGGYYVTCASDTIFADESTITGSIGVLAGKLVTTEMWHKIGVNWKEYNRGKNAGLLSSSTAFSPDEREHVQGWMNDIYGVFKKHVTDIRGKKLTKPIDEIAGGRVYTGKQALELGLVDKLGTLDDAIAFVAKEAKVTDYEVHPIPEPKNFFEKLMEEQNGTEDDRGYVGLSSALPHTSSASLVDLARPLLAGIDPQRAQAVLEALHRLELLQQDRVLLVMPDCPSVR